jgi:hypothetical protein
MSAILQRLFYGLDGTGFPAVQNLHREETLLAECEWDWKPCAEDGAHRFPDHQAAEARVADFTWTDGSGHVVKPFAVTCCEPDVAGRVRREEDRIATALLADSEMRGVSPKVMSSPNAGERRRADRRNRDVAKSRKARRDAHMDEVLEGMERRHPHEEVYAETQRRIGEHD